MTYIYRQSGLNSGRGFTSLQRNPDISDIVLPHESHSIKYSCVLLSRIYQRQISEIHLSQAKVLGKSRRSGLTAAV